MPHFQKITEHVDVSELLAEIDAQPDLWNQHRLRKDASDSPHRDVDDIWLRYNDYENLRTDRQSFIGPHIPVWYPAYERLPAVRPIIFTLMARVGGEMLGGVFITRVPPGCEVGMHRDAGWHAAYFHKFYVALRSPAASCFGCVHDGETELICPNAGDIHAFDNTLFHFVKNRAETEKMTLIISIHAKQFRSA